VITAVSGTVLTRTTALPVFSGELRSGFFVFAGCSGRVRKLLVVVLPGPNDFKIFTRHRGSCRLDDCLTQALFFRFRVFERKKV